MTIILLVAVLLLLCITVFFSFRASQRFGDNSSVELKIYLDHIRSEFPKLDATIKSEISTNRYENSVALQQAREEISRSVTSFTNSINEKLDQLTSRIEQKLKEGAELAVSHNRDNRKELRENLESFKTDLSNTLANFNDRQRENFNNLTKSQDNQNAAITEKIAAMNIALQEGLKTMQDSNEKKLEEMRKTVDEKLHDTLEKRLGESFKFVSERLEAVHKGLGDMQSLATNVGDLKKVMSNVKSRGVLGEYQLLNILEDLLTNDQYEKNVKTKEGSGALVEFAIKMPNGRDTQKSLWLPIDSKFPKEDYESLVQAYDDGDHDKIEFFRKAFRAGIIKNARDIQEKYINPPNTTEYGIMFLPFESLYAEVLRTPGLFETIQKDYKITITGPTTLSALINSLQMGFRTLAIEKRSSEVWDLLGAVKTEFSAFGDILDKTQKKLQEASNVIDKAGIRTRAIEKKLRKVQELPSDESIRMIDEIEANFGEENIN
ncbi:DNA recombination protein RmuC [Flavihumibacter solisilvae]|nr:DNA recombination protein RmuC [Flavihumibacter solisilvae]